MTYTLRLYIRFTLIMLTGALLVGVISSFAFLYPEFYNGFLPFHQLRPIHVSAALFWIISGASASILFFKKEAFNSGRPETFPEKAFVYLWIVTIAAIFGFYAFKKFGGREYWEFPPFLCLPLLISWSFLMYSYFTAWRGRTKNPPLYVWMWSTGIIFFLITFLEQNLYTIPWFRQSFLREITVQWKSNGSLVGAWNQMLYGTSLFLMVKLSGDEKIARGPKATFFYFLGLTNLMFNWGHHIYNVPTANWIRYVAYGISMTETLFFVYLIQGFRQMLTDQRRTKHKLSYRFLIASEYWMLINLILAVSMSVPAINRYTHGSHITVAHAMGATIGINSMILLASLGYMLRIDQLPSKNRKYIAKGSLITQWSLSGFWILLIVAGALKGYRDVSLNIASFQEMMKPVIPFLKLFAFTGIALFVGMSMITFQYFIALKRFSFGRIIVERSIVERSLAEKELVKEKEKTVSL